MIKILKKLYQLFVYMSQKTRESSSKSIPKSSLILSNVKESQETDGIMTFTLENANVSIRTGHCTAHTLKLAKYNL